MVNTDKNQDHSNHFSVENSVTTDSGLEITFQLRNRTLKDTFGECRTGDWNSLIISFIQSCDGVSETAIDIWNICSEDIKNMISALEKIEQDIDRQEKVRQKIPELNNS